MINFSLYLIQSSYKQTTKLSSQPDLLQPLAVPAPRLLSTFLDHQQCLVIENHRRLSLISLDSIHLIHLSSIFVIIITLSIHYTFALSLQAHNLPFRQILPIIMDF